MTGEPEPSPEPEGGAIPDRIFCGRTYAGVPSATGTLKNNAIVEASGIVASWRDNETLWVHNDSGRDPLVFATDEDGTDKGSFELPGDVQDLEEIAAGLCPDGEGPCLYLFDTGDNQEAREEVAMFIVDEPDPDDADEMNDPHVDKVRFSYEGGAVDAEGVVVTPDGQTVYLFEKIDADTSRVFRLDGPFVDGAKLTAQWVTTIDSPGVAVDKGRMITAADLHTTGAALVMRVYTGIYEFVFDEGQTVDDLGDIQAQLVTIPLVEPQGEAIAYDHAGFGLWTVSEDLDGDPGQPLHHYDCE